ncbi:hypothetical protein KKG71_00955, partial [Patescibacteria group bacterium]|nr:hypothetical protein [Patescibacteria group bacterium]
DVPTLLQEGKIKAGVCYEPCISTILNYGGVVITDSKELRGAIVDVYVAKKSHLDNNREAYIRVIKSIVEAGEYYNENTLESADIMKDKLGMNRQEVVDTFDKLEIPDLRDNETAFSRNSGYSSLYGLSRKAHNFLSETNGNNAKNIDFDLLINGSLVDEIVKNQQE